MISGSVQVAVSGHPGQKVVGNEALLLVTPPKRSDNTSHYTTAGDTETGENTAIIMRPKLQLAPVSGGRGGK